MAYQFPPDVAQLVSEQMTGSEYNSEDDVLRHALLVFREVKIRQEQLLADVQKGIEQADQGLARPLEIEALIDRCSQKLADEGIRD